jgi:hypothetical protein
LIQVGADLDDPVVREREARGLLEAAAEYPKAALLLIGLQSEAGRNLPATIAAPSAAAWLLTDET